MIPHERTGTSFHGRCIWTIFSNSHSVFYSYLVWYANLVESVMSKDLKIHFLLPWVKVWVKRTLVGRALDTELQSVMSEFVSSINNRLGPTLYSH